MNNFKFIKNILIILFLLSCSSTLNIQRTEGVVGNNLRVYLKVDTMLFPENITEKEYGDRIKYAAMQRAYRLLLEYFYFKTGQRVSSQREIIIFQETLKEPRLYIESETEEYTKLWADFNIEKYNQYLEGVNSSGKK